MRELRKLVNSLLVLALFIQNAAAGVCDEYADNITNSDLEMAARTSNNIVKEFCGALPPEDKVIMAEACTAPYLSYQELQKRYNEALSRAFVVKGLIEIKHDFYEQEKNIVQTRKEQLNKVKEKYDAFNDTVNRALLLESSFQNTFSFKTDPTKDDSEIQTGTPFHAYMNYLQQVNKNTVKKEDLILNKPETLNKFIKDQLCSTNNSTNLCQTFNDNKTTDNQKKVLFDLFTTRYNFEGQKGERSGIPSVQDIEFVKSISDKPGYLQRFKQALKINEGIEGTTPMSVVRYKKKYLDNMEKAISEYDTSSTEENKTKMLQEFKNVAENSKFINKMSVDRVDFENAAIKKLFAGHEMQQKEKKVKDRVKINYDKFYQGITGREDEDAEQGVTEESLSQVINTYEDFQKTTNQDLLDIEPRLSETLYSKLVKDYTSHLEAAYHELNPRELEVKNQLETQKLKEAKQKLLNEKKSCLDKAKEIDDFGRELKGFDDIAKCMLGDFYHEDIDLNKALQDSSDNYNLYKSLIRRIEESEGFKGLQKKKEDMILEYMQTCQERFTTSKYSYRVKGCDGDLHETTEDKTVIELIENGLNISTFITGELAKKIQDEQAAREQAEKEETTPPETQTTDTTTDNQPNNNSRRDNDEDEVENTSPEGREVVYVEDYFGEGEKTYQPSTLDAIVQGSFNGAAAMGPSFLRYQQMRYQSQAAMADARYRQNQYLMNSFSPYPSYYPQVNNGLMSNLTYQSGLYFRSPQTPMYYYNSNNSSYLYSGINGTYSPYSNYYSPGNSSYTRSATGAGSLNIPVNFAR